MQWHHDHCRNSSQQARGPYTRRRLLIRSLCASGLHRQQVVEVDQRGLVRGHFRLRVGVHKVPAKVSARAGRGEHDYVVMTISLLHREVFVAPTGKDQLHRDARRKTVFNFKRSHSGEFGGPRDLMPTASIGRPSCAAMNASYAALSDAFTFTNRFI